MNMRCLLYTSLIIEEETEENNVQIEPVAPTKEEVFAMREKVLDGMTDDEKERLTAVSYTHLDVYKRQTLRYAGE